MFYRSIGIWLINGLCFIDRSAYIDQRALFDNELCCNSILHPSIDQKKILNLTWFLWFSDISNRKRLDLNSRAKRLHTPGETTSDSGRIDSGSGRTGHRAKRPASDFRLEQLKTYLPNDVLDLPLSKFFISVRKQNGTECEPGTLSGFQRSFQRHLHEKGSLINILKDKDFPSPEKCLLPNERTWFGKEKETVQMP